MLVSGGVDSAVALFATLRQGRTVRAITFDFAGRPRQERRATFAVVAAAGLPPPLAVPVTFLTEREDLEAAGPLANPAIAGAAPTYIPGRNMIFYGVAAYHAEVLGFRGIVGGHVLQDAKAFPDARPRYFAALERLLNDGLVTGRRSPVQIHTPLIRMRKDRVLELGEQLGVPIDATWSCIYDDERPCERCASCKERSDGLAALRAGSRKRTSRRAIR